MNTKKSPERDTPVPSRLGSLSEGAADMNVSTRTLRRMISRGELTGYRFGPRMIRIDLDELDRLLRRIPSVRGHD